MSGSEEHAKGDSVHDFVGSRASGPEVGHDGVGLDIDDVRRWLPSLRKASRNALGIHGTELDTEDSLNIIEATVALRVIVGHNDTDQEGT